MYSVVFPLYSLTTIPMLRALPEMILMARSMSPEQLRSTILIFAISATWRSTPR